jgi:hypothetical protein
MSQFVSAAAGAPSDLSDVERLWLAALAVGTVAALDSITPDAASGLLHEAAADDGVHLVGDAERVTIFVHGRQLVAITRDALRRAVATVR